MLVPFINICMNYMQQKTSL